MRRWAACSQSSKTANLFRPASLSLCTSEAVGRQRSFVTFSLKPAVSSLLRRRCQVVWRRPAKPLCLGSNPIGVSLNARSLVSFRPSAIRAPVRAPPGLFRDMGSESGDANVG